MSTFPNGNEIALLHVLILKDFFRKVRTIVFQGETELKATIYTWASLYTEAVVVGACVSKQVHASTHDLMARGLYDSRSVYKSCESV